MLARDPETFQQFVAAATEDGPLQAVYIDGQTLMQSGLAEQAAAVSPAVAEQVQQAAQTGGAVAGVDTKIQKELADARKENDRLRAVVRVSADSLRIVGAYCPSPSDPVPAAPGAGRVGDAAPALDAALRERVLDLRQAVIEAEKQIEYLQGYARAVSKSQPPSNPR